MAAKIPSALLRTSRSFFEYTSRTGGVVIEEVINKSISDSVKKSRINIWWEVPSCPLPQNCHAGWTAINIVDVLRQNQFSGLIEFDAFIKEEVTPLRISEQLCSADVFVRPLPEGNPEIESTLAQLQLRGYDILLLQPGKASPPLPPDEVLWQWSTLKK